MTIKEIATILGKDDSTIRKIGKRLFPDNFMNGHITNLSETQVTAIKLNLGKNSELPKTDLEKELLVMQAMNFQAEKIKTMQSQIAVLKPKAELADKVIRDTTKQYSIRDAGKHLNLSQTEIFNIMRDNHLLTKKNLPTQKALNDCLLSIKTNITDNGNRPQSVMTMENIAYFSKRYIKTTQLSLQGDKE